MIYLTAGTLVVSALDKLGKGIVLREFIALFGCFVYLVMPSLGYDLYTSNNVLAKTWGRFMPISENEYFSFALPAVVIFVLALTWPLNKNGISDEGIVVQQFLESAKKALVKNPKAGIYIVVIGLMMFSVVNFMPDIIGFVLTLFFFASFAGILYVYFTPAFRYKKIILFIFAAIIVVNAIRGGMFTVAVYMGITLFSFFFLGKNTALWKKITLFLFGIFMLMLVQSVKQTYRQMTWRQNYEGSKVALFGTMLWDMAGRADVLLTADAFFPIYYRTNQGFNVALVMRRFPAIKPHDDGANLLRSLAASLVPRVLWPDKPEAGGKYNMKYYVGINLRTWSTNVGPLGEAYGSFGRAGGIIFMFVLAVFIRFAYQRVFILAKKIPLLIFWIPVMFYQITYSAESDTLQILNSLLKSAFFIFLLYKFLPQWFGMQKKEQRSVSQPLSTI